MENHPLARWRKSHKQTLNDLARAAGCAVSHLSQIESGKTNPSLKLIAKLKSITNGAIDASHFMPQETAPAAKSRVSVGKVKFGNDLPLSFIAGPCQMESREHALEVASTLAKIAKKLKIGLIYKTSFDKANRTSAKAARGIGIERAIPIFREITAKTGLPTLTDVHEAEQCAQLSGVVDVLQIPAFLCRQTDLLLAAAKTGCVVNVKKGQFLAPWDMKNVVTKLTGAGNRNVLVTERGASFGYNTLVSDMRALPILARTTGAPVIFDATHSVQQPGGNGTSSGGEREFVPVLARAAVAVGVAGVFIETHPDPDNAPSDGPNMVPLRSFEALARMLMTFDKLAKAIPVSSKAP
jgi:2-dehydro-3-deoxyphosphooctonate aldolase (KDO 8-P synthase)